MGERTKLKNIKLSIIVPIYNVENYLEQCLGSICGQAGEDVQVICIDDCSTDNSLNILYKWQKRYANLEIYCNEVNLGQASTRNVGMTHARGEYIMFVDSDDYIEDDWIDELIAIARENKADVVEFSAKRFIHNGWTEFCLNDFFELKKNYDCKKGVSLFSEMIKENERFGSVCKVIYRLEYIRKENLKFISGVLHEDIPFHFEAMLKADRACAIERTGYYYRQRNNSTMYSLNYAQRLEGMFVAYLEMIQIWYRYNCNHIVDEVESIYINQYLDEKFATLRYLYLLTLLGGKEKNNSAIESIINSFYEENYKKRIFDEFRNKEIAIYGAGQRSIEMLSVMKQNGIKVNAIYVTDTKNNPSELMGVKVCKYKKEVIEFNTLIVVALYKRKEVIELLKKDNIDFISI